MIKEILKILENDARATGKQIATMTGTTAAEVSKLVKQAEQEKAILKYKAVVNWEKVGRVQVWALIEVKITPQRDVGFDGGYGPGQVAFDDLFHHPRHVHVPGSCSGRARCSLPRGR